nr:MAG TPA: hypothetical protein [Caudoviricetes sp.]
MVFGITCVLAELRAHYPNTNTKRRRKRRKKKQSNETITPPPPPFRNDITLSQRHHPEPTMLRQQT